MKNNQYVEELRMA